MLTMTRIVRLPNPSAIWTPAEDARRPSMRRRVAALALLAVYGYLLQYAYQHRIAPAFGYLNLRYRAPDLVFYSLAAGIVAIISLAMPRRLGRPSDMILWLLFVMVAVPSILVPQYADILPPGQAIQVASVVGVLFLLITMAVRAVKGHSLGRAGSRHWAVALIIVSILTYAYMAVTVGLSVHLVGLGDVGGLRDGYRASTASYGALLGYLVRLQGNVINPLVIARGMYTRRWRLVVLGTLGQILIFSVTGFKLTLLSVPAVILLAVALRRRGLPSGRMLIGGAVVICAIALVADGVVGGTFWTEVFVDRLFLTPGEMTAAHVEVFSVYSPVEWGYSFLSHWVSYPYTVNPDFLVGQVWFNSPDTSANANLFADGYTNYGYVGMLIESLALVVILWVVDAAAARLPMKVTAIIMLLPTIALCNSSSFTGVLTDGIGFAIVAMLMLPAPEIVEMPLWVP